jgi:threonine aldolase
MNLAETDCEVFCVTTGTAASALALASLCRPHQSVTCHQIAHIGTDGCGAPEFFSGVLAKTGHPWASLP